MEETDYTVDKPERIAGILKDLDHKLTLVNVRLDDDGPLYNSALVRLDSGARELFLDELTPIEANRHAQEGTGMRVFASLRGVAVRFSTAVSRIEREDAGALYVCPYPETLEYLQRRETFRVHIPISERPRVELQYREWEEPGIGDLADLSAQGMCVEVPQDWVETIEIGTPMRFENLLLPEVGERLGGDLRLANRRRSPRDGYVYAGFQVTGMNQWLERQFNIALLHYQREARRRSME
ncbi:MULTISPECIES: flagellar brake protein [unclassified Thioalkalivibrio]|uniref:flagellar brake protein n=1 Tax=unclassified Thioalkalivibrio TaxID=2621013 RepID=UPI0003730BC6|nr:MULTISPECIES: flagellar brake protein [unclassified Thioalkalivibrio]